MALADHPCAQSGNRVHDFRHGRCTWCGAPAVDQWEQIVRAIHLILDGDPAQRPVEWNHGTIEAVAAVITRAGLRIRQPGEGVDCPQCEDGWTASTNTRERKAARPCLTCARDLAEEEAEDRCRDCGRPTDDGEGWDGLCGECADRVDANLRP